jgi:NADH-quinone oxidoreductase subunit H
MTPEFLIAAAIKSIILILFLTIGFAYTTLYERRLQARIQVRIGPNRAGPAGILQPIADAVKLIFKEELTPATADKLLFLLAPVITVLPALIVTAVIPWGPDVNIFGYIVSLDITNVNVGILYILSVTSIAVYGITLGGWSSNNKYSTLGALRATAQMISYELVMAFSIMGPVMIAGSMNLADIINGQRNIWYIGFQPLAFVVFVLAALAEVNRAPFDMPEAEQELTAGYHTEYSGMKFALFFMAEYIKMIAVSMLGATLFFGGYLGPGIDTYPWLGPIYLFIKIILGLFFIIWVRATWPRVRYDRLMMLGWKVLFPIILLSVVVTGVVLLVIGG